MSGHAEFTHQGFEISNTGASKPNIGDECNVLCGAGTLINNNWPLESTYTHTHYDLTVSQQVGKLELEYL